MPISIVVLDGYALNPGDLSWDALRSLGHLKVHDQTAPDDVAGRARGAQILLTNKTPLCADTLSQLPDLRFIGVLATGYDIVDVAAAAERRIPVSNIPTYGTHSVAQFTFALLLELCHRVGRHDDDVRAGGWSTHGEWTYHLSPLVELADKTIGLIGLGRIGHQTAAVARAFGMNVVAADPGMEADEDVESVSIDELLRRSDVVSLHCPLTPETRGIINAERLSLMKPTAFLINTARGPLVIEQDLAQALNDRRIAGAALDVLEAEPPAAENPLLHARNCIVTPHIAWSTREARQRLMDAAVANVQAFLAGAPVNVVNAG